MQPLALPFIQFEILNHHQDRVVHFSSTRHGGVSTGDAASLNLGFQPHDLAENVVQNRAILANALGIAPASFCLAQQTHSNHIEVVAASMRGAGMYAEHTAIPHCDAMITNVPGICIAVKTADCTPVLLYDPHKQIVAAIHAGWRGTVAQITLHTVQRMLHQFGCDPQHIVAAIGPSIGACCYEVGPEVAEAVQQQLPTVPGSVLRWNATTNKYHLDVGQANYEQLLQAGLHSHHIERSSYCTQCCHQDFFSSRQYKGNTGRMLTGILLRD